VTVNIPLVWVKLLWAVNGNPDLYLYSCLCECSLKTLNNYCVSVYLWACSMCCTRWLYWRGKLTSGVLTCLNEHLVLRVAVCSTRSASLPLLTVPKLTSDFSRCSFCYSTSVTWNSLPSNILLSISDSVFKKHSENISLHCLTDCHLAPLKLCIRPYININIIIIIIYWVKNLSNKKLHFLWQLQLLVF